MCNRSLITPALPCANSATAYIRANYIDQRKIEWRVGEITGQLLKTRHFLYWFYFYSQIILAWMTLSLDRNIGSQISVCNWIGEARIFLLEMMASVHLLSIKSWKYSLYIPRRRKQPVWWCCEKVKRAIFLLFRSEHHMFFASKVSTWFNRIRANACQARELIRFYFRGSDVIYDEPFVQCIHHSLSFPPTPVNWTKRDDFFLCQAES